MYEHVNESKLNPEDRLGLAYCRMNCWEWDDYMGNKPEGFEEGNKFEMLKYQRPIASIPTSLLF